MLRRQTQRLHIVCFPFIWNMQNRWIHRERHRLVVSRGWGEGRMGRKCLMGQGIYFGMMEMCWTRRRWWRLNTLKVLNATELFTSKWLPLYELYFIKLCLKWKRLISRLYTNKGVFHFFSRTFKKITMKDENILPLMFGLNLGGRWETLFLSLCLHPPTKSCIKMY